MEFDDSEDSYNYLPKLLQALQESLSGIIVQYVTQPIVVDSVEDNSCHILERVLWAFKTCIYGFNYCKPIVQVDGTFLTNKYHGTLFTTISQDGNHNIFLLAFAIVEGETKVAMTWFFSVITWICHTPTKCLPHK